MTNKNTISEGFVTVRTLQCKFEDIERETNWTPKDLSNRSIERLVEAKAFLKWAQKRLTRIATEEGYEGKQ